MQSIESSTYMLFTITAILVDTMEKTCKMEKISRTINRNVTNQNACKQQVILHTLNSYKLQCSHTQLYFYQTFSNLKDKTAKTIVIHGNQQAIKLCSQTQT